MVTIIAGAVAVGIVSVCAIPFGCFMSRRMKKKVLITPEIVDEPETGNEELAFNEAEEAAAIEPRYQIEEVSSRRSNGRSPRVEIRVLVSDGSSGLIEIGSQGYATASGSSSSSSSGQEEARRLSLQNFAAGPATGRINRARNYSLPIAARIGQSSNSGSQNCDGTRLEITISGGFTKNVAKFGEFKNDVQDSSTPKSRRAKAAPDRHTDDSENRERFSFWRRASFERNEPRKTFKTTRDVEVVDIDVTYGDELRRRRDTRPHLTGEPEEGQNHEINGYKPRADVTGPSRDDEFTCERGRWGLPSRLLETLKETTSFITL